MRALPVHTPEPLRVQRVLRETKDTVTISLDASARPGGFPFQPGQFTMLYAFGVGEVPISVSGDPARPERLVHTIRNVGAVTSVLASARRGAVVGVRGPFGAPWPLEQARGNDLLLVAGGLGLAPLRPALLHLLAARRAYGHVTLLVGARAPEALLYRSELMKWARDDRIQVLVTVDRAPPDWRGHVGVVTALLSEAVVRPERAVALVCGPELMMRFAVRELNRFGIDDARIHLSMERNMKCGVGHCGHCQYGPEFICKDGPVLRFDRLRSRFWVKEV